MFNKNNVRGSVMRCLWRLNQRRIKAPLHENGSLVCAWDEHPFKETRGGQTMSLSSSSRKYKSIRSQPLCKDVGSHVEMKQNSPQKTQLMGKEEITLIMFRTHYMGVLESTLPFEIFELYLKKTNTS